MRHEPNLRLERFRIQVGEYQSPAGVNWGAFAVPCGSVTLQAISSGSHVPVELNPKQPEVADWEHVSVSLPHRCPTWLEMCAVKELFWADDETVIQLHVPKARWISYHPYCLHLWRNVRVEQPLPPPITLVPNGME